MAPICIGFIGLSVSPGAWANNAHFPYLKSIPEKYQIVALCNSTVEAAHAAIKHHGLDPTITKAYGNPADLAADPDVDLVVCSIRVDRHYAAVKPALEAGKDVFVEWPLGKNLQEAEELASLAKKKGVKTMIGLQGREDPLWTKIREVVEGGKIGDVHSVNVYGIAGFWGSTIPEGLSFVLDKEIGGNLVTIIFGHFIDMFTAGMGEFSSFTTLLANQRQTVAIADADGKVIDPARPKTSHDQLILSGTLNSGAVVSVHWRAGMAFPGEPGLRWAIYGSKGQISITSPRANLQVGHPGLSAKVSVDGVEEVEELQTEWEYRGWEGTRVENVARLYEGFLKGDGSVKGFEWALGRHRLIDGVYEGEWKASA